MALSDFLLSVGAKLDKSWDNLGKDAEAKLAGLKTAIAGLKIAPFATQAEFNKLTEQITKVVNSLNTLTGTFAQGSGKVKQSVSDIGSVSGTVTAKITTDINKIVTANQQAEASYNRLKAAIATTVNVIPTQVIGGRPQIITPLVQPIITPTPFVRPPTPTPVPTPTPIPMPAPIIQPTVAKFPVMYDPKQLRMIAGITHDWSMITNQARERLDALNKTFLAGGMSAAVYGKQAGIAANQIKQLDWANRFAGWSANSLLTAIGKVFIWTLATGVIYGAYRVVENLTTQTRELDTATMQLNKVLRTQIDIYGQVINVTNQTQIAYSKIELGKIGVEVAKNLQEALRTQTDFVRQGFTLAESLDLTKTALMAQNVAEMTVAESTKALTSVVHQFNLSAFQSMDVMNKWNEITNKIGGTTKDLALSVEKAGSTWRLANKATESSLTTLNAVTLALLKTTGRSGTEIGTAVRAMAVNFMDLEKRGKSVATEFGKIGINVLATKDSFRPMIEVLSDLAGKWGNLSEVQKANLARVAAMKWHYSSFNALLNSFNQVTLATIIQLQSQNSMFKENSIFMERLDSKLKLLQVTWQQVTLGTGSGFVNMLKGATDGLRYFLAGLTAIPGGLMLFVAAAPLVIGSIMGIRNALIGLGIAIKAAERASVILTLAQIGFIAGTAVLGYYASKQVEATAKIERDIEVRRQQNSLLGETRELLPFLTKEYFRLSDSITQTQVKTAELMKERKPLEFKVAQIAPLIMPTLPPTPEVVTKYPELDITDAQKKYKELSISIKEQEKVTRDSVKVRSVLETYLAQTAKDLGMKTLKDYIANATTRAAREKLTTEYIVLLQDKIKMKVFDTNAKIADSYYKMADAVMLDTDNIITVWESGIIGLKAFGIGIWTSFSEVSNAMFLAIGLAIKGILDLLYIISDFIAKMPAGVPGQGIAAGIAKGLENASFWAEKFNIRMAQQLNQNKTMMADLTSGRWGAEEAQKIIDEKMRVRLLERERLLEKARAVGFAGLSQLLESTEGVVLPLKDVKTGVDAVGGAMDNLLQAWIETKRKTMEATQANEDFIATFEDYQNAINLQKQMRLENDSLKNSIEKILGIRKEQSVIEKTLGELQGLYAGRHEQLLGILKDTTGRFIQFKNQLRDSAEETGNLDHAVTGIIRRFVELEAQTIKAGKKIKVFDPTVMKGFLSDLQEILSGTTTIAQQLPSSIAAYQQKQFAKQIVPGMAGEVTRGIKEHGYKAIDIKAGMGEQILAGFTGIVTSAKWKGDYGKTVEILFKDAQGIWQKALYGHMNEIKAKVGDIVKPTDLIGLVGSTGRSTGPHVHMEINQATEVLVKDFGKTLEDKFKTFKMPLAISQRISEELQVVLGRHPDWEKSFAGYTALLNDLKASLLKSLTEVKDISIQKRQELMKAIEVIEALRFDVSKQIVGVEQFKTAYNAIGQILESNNQKWSDAINKIEQFNVVIAENQLNFAKLGISYDTSLTAIEDVKQQIIDLTDKLKVADEGTESLNNIRDTIGEFVKLRGIQQLNNDLLNWNKTTNEGKQSFSFYNNALNETIDLSQLYSDSIINVNKPLSLQDSIIRSLSGDTEAWNNLLANVNDNTIKEINLAIDRLDILSLQEKAQLKLALATFYRTQIDKESAQEQAKLNILSEDIKTRQLAYNEVLFKEGKILEGTSAERAFAIEQLSILSNVILPKQVEELAKARKEMEKNPEAYLKAQQAVNQTTGEIQKQKEALDPIPKMIHDMATSITQDLQNALISGVMGLTKSTQKEQIEATKTLKDFAKQRRDILRSEADKIFPPSVGEEFRRRMEETIESLTKTFMDEEKVKEDLDKLKNPFLRFADWFKTDLAPKIQETLMKAIIEGVTEGFAIKEQVSGFIRDMISPLTMRQAIGQVATGLTAIGAGGVMTGAMGIGAVTNINTAIDTLSRELAVASGKGFIKPPVSPEQMDMGTTGAIGLAGLDLTKLTAGQGIAGGIGTGMLGNLLAGVLTGGQLGEQAQTASMIGTGLGTGLGAILGSVIPVIGTGLGALIGGGLGGLFGSFFGGESEMQKNARQQAEATKKAIAAMEENTKTLQISNTLYGQIRDITAANLVALPASAYYAGRYAPMLAFEAQRETRQAINIQAQVNVNIDGSQIPLKALTVQTIRNNSNRGDNLNYR